MINFLNFVHGTGFYGSQNPTKSVLTLLVGSSDPYKPVPGMTYNVFGGTLNLTELYNNVDYNANIGIVYSHVVYLHFKIRLLTRTDLSSVV